MKPKAETATAPLTVIGVDIGKESLGSALTERSPSEGRSSAWVSGMSSRSGRRASAWKPT